MNLLIEISHHGYGHLTQTAQALSPFIHRLCFDKIFIRSSISYDMLKNKFLDLNFTHINEPSDPCLNMIDALNIDIEKSRNSYQSLLKNWDSEKSRLKNLLLDLQISIVFSNISFQILEAAYECNIPSVALSSLNWADLISHYLHSNDMNFRDIHTRIIKCYNLSSYFYAVKPGLDHSLIKPQKNLSLLNHNFKSQKNEILNQLKLPAETKIILISFGGMNLYFYPSNWVIPKNIVLLTPAYITADNVSNFDYSKLPFEFKSILASSDFVITKLGYGFVSEITALGINCLYVKRNDWPEETFFSSWLNKYSYSEAISNLEFQNGLFFDRIRFENNKKYCINTTNETSELFHDFKKLLNL
ncbi:MAG: hypothetical protein J0M15_07900 [Deltaproteobacteria bacterium]|nr:hypothetical protein [Deltaproteobacteria bacterium]